jgi:glycosyltransferase involved in cell wall biosynthesis
VKPCVVIPCFNHVATVAAVARAAQALCPVLVVDDGSTVPLPDMPGVTVLRLERNGGKGAALRAGFQRAVELGFSHAITLDADGQHYAEDIPKFLAVAQAQPDALGVGVRDFYASGCPAGRRRSNMVSTFWFRVETGVRLRDSQCGFRCYPLALTQRLKTRSGHYAFELEFMVRASWVGAPIVAVPVKCSYEPGQLRQSHFRPVVDLAHITIMNIGLVIQSWVVPRTLRVAWSFGEKKSPKKAAAEFFAENAHDPWRMSLAVGLGLFFGIAPIWGYQMIVAAVVAHFLRLNKAITLLASNISIPPMMPIILYSALALGHWLLTGHKLALDFSAQQMTRARGMEYLGQWFVGSLALAAGVAVVGTVATYGLARWSRQR